MRTAARRGVWAAAALAVCAAVAGAEVRYAVVELGCLFADKDLTFAYDVNDSGEVAGYCQVQNPGGPNGACEGFLYTGGILHGLGTLGGTDSLAGGLSNGGTVTGWALDGSGVSKAFLYDHPGPMQGIGPAGLTGRGSDINGSGEVVGTANITAHYYSGSAWTDLGTIAGGTYSDGYGINAHGEMVGSGDNVDGYQRGFYCAGVGSALVDLGTLGGFFSDAFAINDAGTIVGSADVGGNVYHAYRKPAGGAMQDLGLMEAGSFQSWAFDVNESGVIVGRCETSQGLRGFVRSGSALEDLNDLIDPALGITIEEARAVNESGWIAANGVDASGRDRAFLLVPEPATLGLAAAGAAALWRRRRVG